MIRTALVLAAASVMSLLAQEPRRWLAVNRTELAGTFDVN